MKGEAQGGQGEESPREEGEEARQGGAWHGGGP